jgi:NADPH-dependent 2,4-dienoyl-CoA reductase/sulfur reductase-like enzyme
VIVTGRIRTPAVARNALANGQTDLIGLGRPFLADPDWVRKAEAGEEDDILLCAACHQGCLAELRKGSGTSCVFNPMTGREAEVQMTPAAKPRHVMVVGGGPAGLEAACVAAERRHRVTLHEQESRLGGQFHLAAIPPHKEGFRDVIRHLELRARRAGVDIRTDSQVTADMVVRAGADVVILATGAVPLNVHFPGLDSAPWVLSADLLDGVVEVTSHTALVIGGGLVGLETADFLASRGKEVTVVEMLDEVGSDMDPLAKAMITKRLNQHGAAIHTGTKVIRLTENTVIASKEDSEVSFPAETVVIAVGVRANRALPDALAGSDMEIFVIGDAVEPRKALEAIYEGFEIGRRF